MWTPDITTLYVTLILTDLILTLILVLYWKNYRTYIGYKTWVLSLPVYCCSLILILFRSTLPDYLSIVLANCLFILAYLMRLDSIWKFVHSKHLDLKFYSIFLAITLVVIAYFTYSINSIALRGIFLSIALPAISIAGSIPLITSPEKETRTIRFALAGTIAVIAILYIIRSLMLFGVPGTNTLFDTDVFTFIYYYSLILTDIAATGLFIMLNMARYQAEVVQSEKRIRESEAKYRGVVTWANDGIIMIQDGVFKFMNPKAVTLYGGGEADFINKPFLSSIHPQERKTVGDLYERRMAGERVQEVYETIILNQDGEPVDVELNTRIIDFDGRPIDLVFIRDIRERKRSQKTLEQAKKKLGFLNYVTFNNIRNDIFTLSGYQALVRDMMTNKNTPVEPFLVKEEEMLQKVNDSLNFAQAYQDLGLNPAKWQDVRHAFLMAFSHLETLKIRHDIKTDDLEIFADPLLEQVFQILADNVLTHSETATVITIGYLREPDSSLTILFEDNGVGIATGNKEQIFFPPPQRTKSVGLFLVREILEITGITIGETGESGKGVRFEIRVPKGAFRFASKL
jgi:PAS domain S-box-containing protein